MRRGVPNPGAETSSHYAGLRHAKLVKKYRHCEIAEPFKNSWVRKLTEKEIKEFKDSIYRSIEEAIRRA